VTTAKIADSNVTTAKIADSNVTTAKIADSNITWGKFRKSSASVSMEKYDTSDYRGTWNNGGNKILYGMTGATCTEFSGNSNGTITYYFRKTSAGNITVYYLY